MGRSASRAVRLFRLLVGLAVALTFSLPALAVELTGQIRGLVLDDGGLAVPDAVVTATSPALQGEKSVRSDADGGFVITALPPGEYKVQASAPNMSPGAAVVRVAAGSAVQVRLKLPVAGAEIVITDAKPTVDTTAVQSGATITREMLRDIPSAGRDYQGATTLAPGVVDNGTGNNNVRGATSFGNQYYIDGVNTTDPATNTFSLNMNYDAIEEVQVITGGLDAEYGRAMGGAVNIITRSGGNEFHGDMQLLYSSTDTMWYTKLPEEEGLPDREFADQSLALNLGGPIVKDRLWFFTSLQGNYSVYTPGPDPDLKRPEGFPQQSRQWKSGYWFGKLTFKANANHKIWVHGQGDPTFIDNADASFYTLNNADIYWTQGGWLLSAGHRWTPGDATVVETQATTSNSYLNFIPMAWKGCEEYDEDGYCTSPNPESPELESPLGAWTAYGATDFSYGPGAYAYYSNRKRHSLRSSVTQLLEAAGDHQLKAGFEAELVTAYSIYPGIEDGYANWTATGDPTDLESYAPVEQVKYETNQEAELRGRFFSAYVQDVWQPISRLTLRPGLRMDWANFFNDVGDSVFGDKIALSPRFGVALDPTDSGKTNIHAYYGRFYDMGFLSVSSLLSKRGGAVNVYPWSEQTGTWSETPSYSYAPEFEVHDDLIYPWSDELDIGFSQDLGDGWGLDVTWTWEHSQNMFEDDEVNLIWNDEGTEVVGSRDGTGATRYRLRTPDEAYTDYTSLEIAANRQFNENWGMLASYTWSHAYGQFRDDINYDLASGTMDIATQMDEEEGLLPYDIPHSFKVAGSYRRPDRWELGDRVALGYLLGWNMQASSGYKYRPIHWNSYYGGYNNYEETLDGSYELPMWAQTDLKAGFTLVGGPTTWDITVECFNLFNSRTVTGVYTEATGPDGQPTLDEEGNALFGQPASRQSPRYLQLGLRGEF